MLSAFIISPFIFFARWIASFDFPEAVGPAKRIIFFDKLIYLYTKVSSSIIIINNSQQQSFFTFFENAINNFI